MAEVVKGVERWIRKLVPMVRQEPVRERGLCWPGRAAGWVAAFPVGGGPERSTPCVQDMAIVLSPGSSLTVPHIPTWD